MKRLFRMYAVFVLICMGITLGSCSHSSSGGSDEDEINPPSSSESDDTGEEKEEIDPHEYYIYLENFPHEDDTPDLFAEIEEYNFEGGVTDAATYIGTLTEGGTYSIKITEEADSFSEISTALKNLGDNIYVLLDLSETEAEAIGVYEFKDCTALESVKLPDTVEIIKYSFYGCTSLKYIIIPSSVKEIWSSSFQGCTSLESIYIPSSVTTMQTSTFQECTSLKKASIEAKGIGSKAFYGCTSLTEVYIAKTVTSIVQNAFKGCSNLTSATFEALSGWGFGTGSSKETIMEENIGNTETAAKYLTETYVSKNWSWS